jgi:chorismate mutase
LFKFVCAGLYSPVLGQCSEALEDRLHSHHSYPAADQGKIALLTIIKTLLHMFEERQKLADAVAEIKEIFS